MSEYYNSSNDQQAINRYNNCIKKCLNTYALEKAATLLPRCHNPIFVPLGVTMCFSLVEADVRRGIDGYSGKTLQQSPISIDSFEVECFSKCYYGKQFAAEVSEIYKRIDRSN